MMPRMDGIEAVRIIRTEIDTDYARTVPFIALTANAIVGIEDMFIASGFQGFISKPIDIKQLNFVLNKWIRDVQDPVTLERAERERRQALRSLRDQKGPAGPSVLESRHIPGLNTAEGLARCGGKESAYLPLLESWARHTGKVLEELSPGGPEMDFKAYGVAVHGLKGSCYGVCAVKAGELASELEQAARREDHVFIAETPPIFVVTASALIADLHALLHDYKSASGLLEREERPSPDPRLLRSIHDNCASFKTSLIRRDIRQLQKYTYAKDGGLVDFLREQAENLEYEKIRDRLASYLSLEGG